MSVRALGFTTILMIEMDVMPTFLNPYDEGACDEPALPIQNGNWHAMMRVLHAGATRHVKPDSIFGFSNDGPLLILNQDDNFIPLQCAHNQ